MLIFGKISNNNRALSNYNHHLIAIQIEVMFALFADHVCSNCSNWPRLHLSRDHLAYVYKDLFSSSISLPFFSSIISTTNFPHILFSSKLSQSFHFTLPPIYQHPPPLNIHHFHRSITIHHRSPSIIAHHPSPLTIR